MNRQERLSTQETPSQAIKLYEEFLRQAPDSIEARTNLGVALAQEGRFDEAAQQYRQVLSRDPRNETALLNLGLAIYKQGDFGEARNQFDKLYKLSPGNQQAFYLLADCDLRLGKFQDAITLVRTGLRCSSGRSGTRIRIGHCLDSGRADAERRGRDRPHDAQRKLRGSRRVDGCIAVCGR